MNGYVVLFALVGLFSWRIKGNAPKRGRDRGRRTVRLAGGQWQVNAVAGPECVSQSALKHFIALMLLLPNCRVSVSSPPQGTERHIPDVNGTLSIIDSRLIVGRCLAVVSDPLRG
jgi:hypothetical protein